MLEERLGITPWQGHCASARCGSGAALIRFAGNARCRRSQSVFSRRFLHGKQLCNRWRNSFAAPSAIFYRQRQRQRQGRGRSRSRSRSRSRGQRGHRHPRTGKVGIMSRVRSPSARARARASARAPAPSAGRAGPASHAVSDAATATTPPPQSPPASTTTASSDWLAERKLEPAAAPSEGVAIDTKPHDVAQRGKAVESRRGQR